jgi:uncharacterized protein (TIGR02145 family)
VCTSSSFTIPSAQDAGEGATYKWTVNGADVEGATGNSYTNTAGLAAAGTYVYVRLAHTDDCGWQASNGYIVWCCDAPGSTVDFTVFSPCVASVGATWTLKDTRESGNIHSYKVKLMADGHYWMVQDLKFGNQCGTAFSGSSGSDKSGTTNVSSIGTYYGDCINNTYTGAGNLYDWAATIQKPGAYYGTSTDVGCSSTTSGTSCQGICPAGWHIPTGGSDGEYQVLHTAMTKADCSGVACWNSTSAWEGVLGGYCNSGGSLSYQDSRAYYWSSTYYSPHDAYALYFYSTTVYPGTNYNTKYNGFSVRCVRNY